MIICARCNSQMMEGTLFCDECGFNLLDHSKREASTTQIDVAFSEGGGVRGGWGTATFEDARQVLIYIRDINDPLTITPSEGFLIGRADADRKFVPDLDLGPFGGLEKGVSRKHASLSPGDGTLSIIDLGSANGTFLNGTRLSTNQPRLLRDGDEVRLGNLSFYVYFR